MLEKMLLRQKPQCLLVHSRYSMRSDHSDYAHGYLLVFPLASAEFLFRSLSYSNQFFPNSQFVVSMQFTCSVSISVS